MKNGKKKKKASMAKNIEGFEFEQSHGKERVRVARVWKSKDGQQHFVVEWRVSINLLSDCVNSYIRDDNSDIVATDTMKNTVTYSSLLLLWFFLFSWFWMSEIIIVKIWSQIWLCWKKNICPKILGTIHYQMQFYI